jgi:hypothetical protein
MQAAATGTSKLQGSSVNPTSKAAAALIVIAELRRVSKDGNAIED